MRTDPRFDVGPTPEAAHGELCHGCREVGVGVHQLVYTLTTDAQHARYLDHADRVAGHRKKS
jgi:hypothetical protein